MFDAHEIWNLTPDLIPPRSHLYYLEPIGVGTPYVESLTSYIARLALSHHVTPEALLFSKIAPLAKKNYDPEIEIGISQIYGKTRHLNGMSPEVISHIKALESLTLRDDLQSITMLPWSRVIAKEGLLRKNKAWCAHCYEEWRMSKQAIYEPLIWFLKVIKFCPFHYQVLCERCPRCNRPNHPLCGQSIPGYCSHCKQWLGTLEKIGATAIFNFVGDDLKYENWVLENIGKLVSTPACLTARLSKEGTAEVFSSYAKSVGSIAELARLLKMPKHKVHSLTTGKYLITINSLLLMCYSLETEVVKLLTAKPTSIELSKLAARQILQQYQRHRCPRKTPNTWTQKRRIPQEALSEYPPPSVEELAKRQGYAYEYSLRSLKTLDLWNAVIIRYKNYQDTQRLNNQELVLKSALESEEYPPLPMKRVAEEAGWAATTLYKNFPKLCQAISKRYITYREMAGIRRMLRSRKQIWLIANEIHKEGVRPTNSRILCRLKNPTIIPRKKVCLVMEEARRRLGWE